VFLMHVDCVSDERRGSPICVSSATAARFRVVFEAGGTVEIRELPRTDE